jgi:peroxiredoxin
MLRLPLATVFAALVFTSGAHAQVGAGALASDFTLRSLSGPNLRLAELRGQVVLVAFWASWCRPCREPMPMLNRLYEKHRDNGLTLLGVSVDQNGARASAFADGHGVRYSVLLDDEGTASARFDPGALPALVLIDRDGLVRRVVRGYESGYEAVLERAIAELLTP